MIYESQFYKGQKLLLGDGKKTVPAKVMEIIPMRHWDDARDQWKPIYDYEILIDKKNNKYFSLDMFNKGESWVKTIEFVRRARSVHESN